MQDANRGRLYDSNKCFRYLFFYFCAFQLYIEIYVSYYLDPCRVDLTSGSIRYNNRNFVKFHNIERTQVVETFLNKRQCSVYYAQSIAWSMISWGRNEQGASHDRLISNMGIPIPGETVFIWAWPWSLIKCNIQLVRLEYSGSRTTPKVQQRVCIGTWWPYGQMRHEFVSNYVAKLRFCSGNNFGITVKEFNFILWIWSDTDVITTTKYALDYTFFVVVWSNKLRSIWPCKIYCWSLVRNILYLWHTWGNLCGWYIVMSVVKCQMMWFGDTGLFPGLIQVHYQDPDTDRNTLSIFWPQMHRFSSMKSYQRPHNNLKYTMLNLLYILATFFQKLILRCRLHFETCAICYRKINANYIVHTKRFMCTP